MDPANESFICSASVLSYERRGKETWYNILIVPRQEPCYTIHRRYQDFVHLSNQLIIAFPQYASRKKYQSCFPCRQSSTTDIKSSPPSPIPPSEFRSFKDQYNHHYHRIISSCSLPRLSSSILLTPSCSSSSSTVPKSSSSLSYASNDCFLQLIANRKRRQRQLDRYLYDLFRMPAEVHQSSFLFEFLNFRPFLFFPLLQNSQQYIPSPLASSSSPVLSSPSASSSILTSASASSPRPAPVSVAAAAACSLFPRRYSKSLPPSPTLSHASHLPTPITSIQEPQSQLTKYVTKSPGNCNNDNQDSLPNSITISLYLGPGSFVSTTCPRHHLQFDMLRRRLNNCLCEQGLESLPASSVLAYNHIAASDRQGALETLTLNQKEPWMEYDHVMALALSHRIAFFASTLPVPEKSTSVSSSVSSSSIVLSSSKTDSSQQKQQQPAAPALQWKYTKNALLEDDDNGKVLLISCDNDLQAALNGKWRRLDHVTLSCLAW